MFLFHAESSFSFDLRPKLGYVRITWCVPLQQGMTIRVDCMADAVGWGGCVKSLEKVGAVRELTDDEQVRDVEVGSRVMSVVVCS